MTLRSQRLVLTGRHRFLILLVTSALAMAGCGPSSSSTATPAPSMSPSRPAFVVENGKVQGPERISAKVGDEVVFVVTTDRSDEVHVHGYDVSVAARSRRPATVRISADIPGIFEVELEESRLVLTQLRVTP